MRKFAVGTVALASLLSLSACGSGGLFNRDRPDEFAVTRAAPLVVPPDFALVPPQPGAPRPQDASAQDEVLETLFGGTAPRSATERAIINSAGQSETGIRSSVGDPDTETVNKGTVTRDIISAPEGDGQTASSAIPG